MATFQAKSVRRREDVRLLTGKGNYAADGAPSGTLTAVFLRSHQAHASISALNVTAARSVPGVRAVVTASDLTDVNPIPGGINFPRPDGSPAPKTDRLLLANDRVRFVGEPIVMVLAETREAGLEACEAILVEYDSLPVVVDPEAAMQPKVSFWVTRVMVFDDDIDPTDLRDVLWGYTTRSHPTRGQVLMEDQRVTPLHLFYSEEERGGAGGPKMAYDCLLDPDPAKRLRSTAFLENFPPEVRQRALAVWES